MDINLAELLVRELEKHPPLSPILLQDRNYIIDLLASTDVLGSSTRFYEIIRGKEIKFRDKAHQQTYVVALTRILRNNLAAEYLERGYEPSTMNIAWEKIAPYFWIYDSNIFTRKLMESPEMLKIMSDSGQPFSLLGRLKILDWLSNKMSEMPILVVHGADLDKVRDWEIKSSEYGRRKFGLTTKIGEEEYFSPR